MENVNNFQKALKEYGVPDQDVFQTVDLFEKKDISQVTNTFFALGRAVSIFFSSFFFIFWICIGLVWIWTKKNRLTLDVNVVGEIDFYLMHLFSLNFRWLQIAQ